MRLQQKEDVSGANSTAGCLPHCREGIYLTGGSTRIPYIDNYLASYTGFSFNLSPFYEKATICGLEKIIRDRDLMKWAQPVKQRKL